MAALAQCYAVAGRQEEARELLGRCPPRESAGGNLTRGIALVHLALGDNKSMGGSIGVASHLDGLVLKPSVWIDGKPLMEAGKLLV